MARNLSDIIEHPKYGNRNLLLFGVYWVAVFVLYLPAAKAGRVGDFPGWVDFLTSNSFIDYINRKGSGIPSMYQFTQTVSYLFYQIFGANAWLWHLLYVTLQALNALLLFVLFLATFVDAALKNATLTAFTGTVIFCACPHISEVVVWEPSFHYLLGLLFILLVLICTRNFIKTQKVRYAWWGGFVFCLSTYSLEVFYLTPLLCLTLALYYYLVLGAEKIIFEKALLFFSLPQLAFFVLHIFLLKTLYREGVAHIGTTALHFNTEMFSKPLKYVFHILLLGRYFSNDIRTKVYHFCESLPGLYLFYGLLTLMLAYIVVRFRSMKIKEKTCILLFTWVFFSVGLIMPLAFPDLGVVILDRYTYVPAAFIYMFMALLVSSISSQYVYVAAMGAYALINARFAHKVNTYWQQSAHIVNNLVATFPNDTTKKVLLLNLPECLQGVQMVGTRDDGEFRMMYDALRPDKLKNPVYDVEAFYMSSPSDGAHVLVANDSTVRVTLNQWGTWWLYYGLGATSYGNADFRVDMKDAGHWYDLVLKQPASQFLLLYMVDGQWKKVDLNKKNVDQN